MPDESAAVPEPWKGHTITLDFDGGYASLRLHCPPGDACSSGSICGGCGRDLESPDPEQKPCYDCPKPGEDRGCWVKSWTDNLSVEDMMQGTLTLAVDPEFDGEGLTLHIVRPV